ncbi:MAG: hypothetical protein ACUVRD_06700 [Bacteroidia bacterium]
MDIAASLGSYVLSAMYLPQDFPERPWDSLSHGNVFRLVLRGLTGDTVRYSYIRDLPCHENPSCWSDLRQRLFGKPTSNLIKRLFRIARRWMQS